MTSPFRAELVDLFDKVKAVRRKGDPASALRLAGELGRRSIEILSECTRAAIQWDGRGTKSYSVFHCRGAPITFSKAVNDALFIEDPSLYATGWKHLTDRVMVAGSGGGALTEIDSGEVDRLIYSTVHAYAAGIDLYKRGDRGSPGSLLEQIMGPICGVMTKRQEAGKIVLRAPGEAEPLSIEVDISFSDASCRHVLVIATKISSRERIVQAYVHQFLLEKLDPGRFRTILCLSNENNMFSTAIPPDERIASKAVLRDTLVPGTIRIYQRYLTPLAGMYYLDPPASYVDGSTPGLPSVRRVGQLLCEDLPNLLS